MNAGCQLGRRAPFNFTENIAQAERHPLAGLHRKSQPVGLIRSVVRILANNDNANLRQGRELQGTQRLVGVNDGTSGQSLSHKAAERQPGRADPEGLEQRHPTGVSRPMGGAPVCQTVVGRRHSGRPCKTKVCLRISSRYLGSFCHGKPCKRRSAEEFRQRLAWLVGAHEHFADQKGMHTGSTHALHIGCCADA